MVLAMDGWMANYRFDYAFRLQMENKSMDQVVERLG